jgi:hypothetical protein
MPHRGDITQNWREMRYGRTRQHITTTMSAPNPLHLANTAQQMARSAPASDAVVFNKVAMVCMGVMAAASVMQVLQPLLRDLNRKHAADDQRRTLGRGR